MHLWMETYLFYCSVRLGVIVVAILTLFQLLVPAGFFLTIGIKIFDPLIDLFKNDEQYNKDYAVKKIFSWIEKSPANFMLLLNLYLLLHSIVCIVAIYGAFKLIKWFLLPFIIMELIRVIYCLTLHILLMIVLKKILNLGVLIAFTLLGGFIILYMGYNWATSVALYQIIELIYSDRYRSLYGDNPFEPLVWQESSGSSRQSFDGTIDNVRVLVTPNQNDINQQKQSNKISKWRRMTTNQPIISVIQVDPYNMEKQPPPAYSSSNYDIDTTYGNWHWSELAGGSRQKKKTFNGQNWN